METVYRVLVVAALQPGPHVSHGVLQDGRLKDGVEAECDEAEAEAEVVVGSLG
jgi:hypothetical protein